MKKLNLGRIFTNDNCIACNRCISKCPITGANYFVNRNGKARIEVDGNKCIQCGYCMDACIHGAREYKDDIDLFMDELSAGGKFSVILAPSFFINYIELAEHVIGYLKHLGVEKVYNAGFGADISVWSSLNYLDTHQDGAVISANCPAIVNYIEKELPELIPNLIPVQTPVFCTAIYAKKYLGDSNSMVLISPCIAKSEEICSQSEADIKYNVTFRHLFEKLEGIDISNYDGEVDLDDVGLGNIFPFPGGLKEYIEYFAGYEKLIWKLDEGGTVYKKFPYFKDEKLVRKLYAVDALSCNRGCIYGPGTDCSTVNKDAFFGNITAIRSKHYNERGNFCDEQLSIKERREMMNQFFSNLNPEDFARTFQDRYEQQYPVPEETIEDIFTQMNKNTFDERNINCQSCGYETCSDMVRAVALGYNDMNNCIHYSKERNIRLLSTDTITGIPNENAYIMFLQKLVDYGRASEYVVANLNIKNFTLVNERFGSEKGDEVIRFFSKKLNELADKDEIVSRVGGNNYFAAFKKEGFAEKLEKCNSITVQIENLDEIIEYPIQIRAGIYYIQEQDTVVSEINNKVAIAFGYAKRVESKDFVYFDENIRKELYQEMLIRKMLPKALENNEFVVFYQPKVSLETYKLSGAEALVRWKQNGEIVPPIKFIPICEKNGFVKQIDFYVLEQICRKIRTWLDEGLEIVKISSNFSKHHFEEKNIADKICGIVDKWNVPHEYIEVEFTETAYIDRQDILSDTIEKLKSYGFSSSMDDFGSGYSSLSLLQALNFDVLKLDKSLLGRGVNDLRTNKIIANIIAMTKDLNMEIIAEGVETRQELEMLHRLNCNVVQGYIFDKPLPEEEFYKRLLNKEYRI